MQAKGLIKFFVAALILVCIYQLLFTYVSVSEESKMGDIALERVTKGEEIDQFVPSDIQNRAEVIDSITKEWSNTKARLLDSISSEVVLNMYFAEYSYQEVKERQLSLGLDLQGGMSVVLQISLEELIRAMSNESEDPDFDKALKLAIERQKNSQENLVVLFGAAYNEVAPEGKLARIFATPEYKDQITFNSTNEEVLSVISEEAKGAIGRTFNILRSRIDQFGVTQPNISLQESSGRIIIELPGVKNPERARALLQATAKLEFWETWDNRSIFNPLMESNEILLEILGLNEEADSSETDSLVSDLLAEEDVEPTTPDTSSAKSDSLSDDSFLDLLTEEGGEGDSTSVDDGLLSAEEARKKFPLFSNGSILMPATGQDENGQVVLQEGPVVGYSFSQDRDKVMEYLSYEEVKALFPRNIKFLWGHQPVGNNIYALYAIKTRPSEDKAPLEGDVIVDARQDYDQNGRPDIDMVMNSEGAKIWKRLTKDNIGNSIAIVLDDVVYSAPVVQGEIGGGRSQITGNFTIKTAKDLSNIIKAGKLPAPAKIVEEEIVGPSLGAESIRAGSMSLVIGLALVLLFMVAYYAKAGLISNVVLVLNLFFIMGVLASFGASLTLPGIAGIVLTIGMAVDANVIIFERVREELARGKGLRLAISDGYSASYSAIVDANVTTLITGFILLFFGLGPVKGFATVLVIGIFSSLLTAVLVSRLIVDKFTGKDKGVTFFTKFSEGMFKNLDLKLLDKRKIAYGLSTLVIALGIISMVTRGFQLGVDFQGGRSYVVRFDQSVNAVDISKALEDEFEIAPQVKTYGADNQVKITTAYRIDEEGIEIDGEIEDMLYSGVKEFFAVQPDKATFMDQYKMSSIKVGPTIADDILKGAYFAAIFSFIGIFLYILVRFRKWQFGLGAITAVVHDMLVVLSIFSIFAGILPFSLEIDQAFIAALLTIIGYSINDTVVVFDRIREYINLHPTTGITGTANMAIDHTLSRTLITSLTTLIVVVILFIFGGEVIRGFSFALLIGIIVGTYSSIFIAAPVAVDTLKKAGTK